VVPIAWAPEPVCIQWAGGKIPTLAGNRTPVVQPVVWSHYTDGGIGDPLQTLLLAYWPVIVSETNVCVFVLSFLNAVFL